MFAVGMLNLPTELNTLVRKGHKVFENLGVKTSGPGLLPAGVVRNN